jgi:hypothetical protein
LPNVGPCIYNVKIYGFTRNSTYIYIYTYISRLRVNMGKKLRKMRWV